MNGRTSFAKAGTAASSRSRRSFRMTGILRLPVASYQHVILSEAKDLKVNSCRNLRSFVASLLRMTELFQALHDLVTVLLRLRHGGGHINGQHFAVAHQDLAVANRGDDRASGGRVHDGRFDGVDRLRFWLLQIDDDDIGALAGLQRSDFVFHAEDSGAADGG